MEAAAPLTSLSFISYLLRSPCPLLPVIPTVGYSADSGYRPSGPLSYHMGPPASQGGSGQASAVFTVHPGQLAGHLPMRPEPGFTIPAAASGFLGPSSEETLDPLPYSPGLQQFEPGAPRPYQHPQVQSPVYSGLSQESSFYMPTSSQSYAEALNLAAAANAAVNAAVHRYEPPALRDTGRQSSFSLYQC
ncbi:unnamed protein product [Protopolystoma xenopodis]|uniref:Uncharacterized protein n=1 Tax=Protopolystoma xenopodis TaxID=117903 RepID=A0A3S4ZYY5_9PLAT|nr:unnamed protein product [Protopolystoma xenopodis]